MDNFTIDGSQVTTLPVISTTTGQIPLINSASIEEVYTIQDPTQQFIQLADCTDASRLGTNGQEEINIHCMESGNVVDNIEMNENNCLDISHLVQVSNIPGSGLELMHENAHQQDVSGNIQPVQPTQCQARSITLSSNGNGNVLTSQINPNQQQIGVQPISGQVLPLQLQQIQPQHVKIAQTVKPPQQVQHVPHHGNPIRKVVRQSPAAAIARSQGYAQTLQPTVIQQQCSPSVPVEKIATGTGQKLFKVVDTAGNVSFYASKLPEQSASEKAHVSTRPQPDIPADVAPTDVSIAPDLNSTSANNISYVGSTSPSTKMSVA